MVSNSGGTGIYVTSGTLTVGSTSSTSNTNPLITSNGGYAINGNFTMYSGRLRSNTNTNVYSGTNLYTTKSGYYWHHNSTSGNYEYYWNTDTTGPTITFGTNGSTTWKKSQSTTVTVTDPGGSGVNIDSLKYRWSQSTDQPVIQAFSTGPSFTNGETITKSDDTGNNWYLWVAARDNMGNTTITRSNAFYLDNTNPTTATLSAGTVSSSKSVKLTATGADANSSIAGYEIYVGGTKVSSTSIYTISNMPFNQSYSCYVIVRDGAGNTKKSSTITVKNDAYVGNSTDMKNLATAVNGGTSFRGKTITQTTNINLGCSSSSQWTPIGKDDSHRFEGTFNGNNYNISNIYINTTSERESRTFWI